MPTTLQIKNLHASVDGKPILKGVNLTVRQGEIHAIMGPNGSGKSTLSRVIMGDPQYKVDEGEILLDGKSVLDLEPDERARLGLFLSFQYPMEVPGVSLSNFLRTAYNSIHPTQQLSVFKFQPLLETRLSELGMQQNFANRYVNDGFSGGEKKRCEILQMSVLEPKIAVLDETDSGLDVDALKIVSEGANRISARTGMGVLLITHYQRILKYVKPQFVHVFVDGKIVQSGDSKLAEELENSGYAKYLPAKTEGAIKLKVK
jgi:Fe-S cluster assembly ATP-binding protein